MKYCINCGEKLPDQAKFCAYCGTTTDLQPDLDPVSTPELPQTAKLATPSDFRPIQDGVPHLHPGEIYCGYRIVKMLNRDPEGIKYVVTRTDYEDIQYLLKLFYKSSSENIAKLYSLQIRLQNLKDFSHPHIAPVVEINDSLSPGFIVSAFVDGIALAELKKTNPDRLSESLVRKIAVQLVSAAIYIRQNGLTMYNLSPVGIILDDNDDIRVSISGITYEDVDEREDVFTIGVILAQLLCHSPFCYTMYGKTRLKEHKFTYITNVSISLNKIVSECLHRNILQRYTTLSGLARELDKLPLLAGDQIWISKNGKVDNFDVNTHNPIPKPHNAIDYRFWILLLILMSTLVVMLYVLGRKPQREISTPMITPGLLSGDSVVSTNNQSPITSPNNIRITGYGDTKSHERSRDRLSAIVNTSRPTTPGSTSPPATQAKTPSLPINMVFVPAQEFIYGNQSATIGLSSFYIGKYEVTQTEWIRYMRPANVSRSGDDLPVDNVSWYDIIEYCNRRSEDEGLEPCYSLNGLTKPLDWSKGRIICDWSANGYRLPTEAEWELTATAQTSYLYSGSNNLAEIAWYSGNAGGRIQSVGSKKANNLGIYDLTGNVSEWCWDWFDAAYLRDLQDSISPTGPVTGFAKVIRGSNIFDTDVNRLNLRSRDRRDPQRGYPFIGFRVIRRY